MPGGTFGEGGRGLRIALGAAPDRATLEERLRALAALLAQGPGGMAAVV
ncbi:hypothetical protein [Teichococcus aestuarii]